MVVSEYFPFQHSSKYEEVARDESEVEGLAGLSDEKNSNGAPRRSSDVSLRCFVAVQCTIVAIFVALISAGYFISKSQKTWNMKQYDAVQMARNAQIEYTYYQDPTMGSLDVSANEYFDNQILPAKGEGMINLKYNGSEEVVNWGITMFHALHCLQHLRQVIQGREGHFPKEFNDRHTGHCFDYLARNLLCAGDSTIERPRRQQSPDGKHHRFAVDGVGATHQCKDTSLMFQMSAKSVEEPLQLGEWQWQPGDTLETVLAIGGMLSADGSLRSQAERSSN